MNARLPELFVDRSLPQSVAERMRALGFQAIWHDDAFSASTSDITWIRACGSNRWIALTKDDLRRDPPALVAIDEAETRIVLVKPSAGLRAADLADVLATHIDSALDLFRRHPDARIVRCSRRSRPIIVRTAAKKPR